MLFQSTLPARGATNGEYAVGGKLMISIHAPRTGSDMLSFSVAASPKQISIHAPRTGSDGSGYVHFSAFSYFNPRSPHGERRGRLREGKMVDLFQSTLPARGATPYD